MRGQSINHYKITAKLGEGGMGAVYRATDTRLGRQVALKIVPEKFARDPQRMGRFQREAEVLASLDHSNISTIHGLEVDGDVQALVLELVEGPTLAERIAEGPIPTEEALGIALEIAQALEAAHEKGIIHRDLKPANVKITPQGKIKVLDFGLAKALDPELTQQELAHSPTLTMESTQEGMVLGTAAYMSPEQARGRPVDRRTDIWAFGCVLLECLTGTQEFGGNTIADSIAKILQKDPDWEGLPQDTPLTIRRLLRRCLEKDPYDRVQHIGDARIEISQVLEQPSDDSYGELETASPARWQRPIPFAAMGLSMLLGAFLGFLLWSPGYDSLPAPPTVGRFTINLPAGQAFPEPPRWWALALSRDGTQLAYAAVEDNTNRLYLRPIGELESHPIPGAEKALMPFFKPDGKWVGFLGDLVGGGHGRLKKVSLLGGAPLNILERPIIYRGMTWSQDGTIFYAAQSGLWRVSETGGTPEQLNPVAWTPQILPGGRALLFYDSSGIRVRSLETGEEKVLDLHGMSPRYASTGHLLYASGPDLLAAPFDLEKLEVRGPSTPVVEGAGIQFDISENGTLAYVPGGGRSRSKPALGDPPPATVVWVDVQGKKSRVTEIECDSSPRLSPDGKRLAVQLEGNIWIYEVDRGSRIPLITDGNSRFPVWTPDGSRIAFVSWPGERHILWAAADGTGEVEPLVKNLSEGLVMTSSWTPDGEVLAYYEQSTDVKKDFDIWVLPVGGKPRPFLATEFRERQPMFSPDGNWLAFTSNLSGRNEVYAVRYPGGGRREPISRNGGQNPVWARSGKQLYYRKGAEMIVVSIQTEPTFKAGNPSSLFEHSYKGGYPFYDIAPDGQSFVMLEHKNWEPLTRINVVLNWFEELKRLVPTGPAQP